ncbi:response regulator transcription factor [Citricoccus sp. K5]|uniref:response regulator transcription factor n=1 Tax=Citricoccus sp. K5 TaxID=2653135 RepID=UPI0012F1E06F|nr:response regulator transcription factor [Citricoccus sp. K5]VXB64343.1 DNA-binding response OmpR family regulator [Citricoccus sp. K5]
MEDRRVAVVVEDDDDIRGLMVALLSQSGFEVHEAANGADGVSLVRRQDPVLITVDLGLPDIDGYEVTRQVRQFTDAYVVMLTARGEEIDTLLGLDAGADDYLTKPFRPRVLRARIEAMLRRPRGGSAAAPAAPASPADASVPETSGGAVPAASSAIPVKIDRHLSLDGLELYPTVHQVVAEGREVPVTPTEFLLLETLMRSGRVVRSKSELSRIIRGDEPDNGTFVSLSDERTVEVHLGNLRRKLKDDPKTPRWVQTVRGVGYRMAGSPQDVR